MEQLFRFAHPIAGLIALSVSLLVLFLRRYTARKVRFRFTHTQTLLRHGAGVSGRYKWVLRAIELVSLLCLSLAVAGPEIVGTDSSVPVEGIDIILVLDMSLSMEFRDYADDVRSRFSVAKDEAARFVQMRDSDAIGLVVFAEDALTRCPLTMDKRLLTSLIKDLKIGLVRPNATFLFKAAVAGANRLRSSCAKSKVMILLTDGQPSSGDLDMAVALEVIQQLGIRVYTVGIGDENGSVVMHPFGMPMQTGINKEVLEEIASETGGAYFNAARASDMRKIYETIDRLEKTEREKVVYTQVTPLFTIPLLLGLLLLMMYLGLTTFVWFTV